jgi:hypothetical protein
MSCLRHRTHSTALSSRSRYIIIQTNRWVFHCFSLFSLLHSIPPITLRYFDSLDTLFVFDISNTPLSFISPHCLDIFHIPLDIILLFSPPHCISSHCAMFRYFDVWTSHNAIFSHSLSIQPFALPSFIFVFRCSILFYLPSVCLPTFPWLPIVTLSHCSK